MTSEFRHEKKHSEDLLVRLSNFAENQGLELIGIAPLQRDELGWFRPHAERLRDWVADEKHAGMKWLSDRVEERCVPHQLLPQAKSALVFWSGHHFEAFPKPKYHTAKVARYAWGRDYHNILKKALRKVYRWLDEELGEHGRYTSVDTGPILERAFGQRSGLGWIGRSTMLIHQHRGTFGSLAVVFLDRAFAQETPSHPFRCGSCIQCLVDCPTNALSDEGLDARLCISYWTIEHRGMIPLGMRAQIGDWVFGCDICQDVCPWNHKAPHTPPDRWRPKSEHAWPDLVQWLSLPDDELDRLLLGSPIRRAKPEGLKRNICIVLANQGAADTVPLLEHIAQNHESSVVRATALWAGVQLGSERILKLTEADAAEEVITERNTLMISP